ncbi:glycosyltransferase family 92 protein [Ekhidna sp.]|uniref:glycosyltransferase family 92 protein n=1 Tax=Ekhidna sp. TaxID=2608089 RepID=UPI003B50E1D1
MAKKHFLTFATNFKNENPYLKDWIEYHVKVGVNHFYLYDQDGGEEAQEILRPYEEKGIVTRHPWTHLDGTRFDGATKWWQRNKNHMGFAHAAKNYRKEFQWLMKIDVDEFLFPIDGSTHLHNWLNTVDVKKIKGIKLPRINFGNNGYDTKPEKSVLEAYIKREENYSDHKDLGNGDFLSSNRFAYSAHWWHYKWYKFGKMLTNTDEMGWRINHYYTKSLEEYLSRQNVSGGRPVGREGFDEKNRGCNDIEDTSMLDLLDNVGWD